MTASVVLGGFALLWLVSALLIPRCFKETPTKDAIGGGFLVSIFFFGSMAGVFNRDKEKSKQRAKSTKTTAAVQSTPASRSELPKYLVVTGREVNIRLSPSLSETKLVVARKGDVFNLTGIEGGWYSIVMFSGDYRYIHSSLAKPTENVPPLPSSAQTRMFACLDSIRAEDRAYEEALAVFPSDINQEVLLQRILTDQYKLPIYRKHGIAPAKKSSLHVECVQEGWIPQ